MLGAHGFRWRKTRHAAYAQVSLSARRSGRWVGRGYRFAGGSGSLCSPRSLPPFVAGMCADVLQQPRRALRRPVVAHREHSAIVPDGYRCNNDEHF